MSGSLAHSPALLDQSLIVTETALHEWGQRVGSLLRPPRTIALSGELGAGKTALVRAICAGYGVTNVVTSPTFALIHKYESQRSEVLHIDLYRLSGEKECAQLGLEEIVASDALVLIEWPERAGDLLPADTVRLILDYVASDSGLRMLRPG